MARWSGAKCVPKNRCQTIYELSSIGVPKIVIARYYNMPRSAVANIIRRYRNSWKKQTKKKMGRRLKFSERGMRLLQRYVLQTCYKSLHVIAARFNDTTGLSISVWTLRRYIKRMKMDRYITVQKPYLSKKSIAARVLWGRTHASWTMKQWATVAFTGESKFYCPPCQESLTCLAALGTQTASTLRSPHL